MEKIIKDCDRPPLGKLRDFDKEDAEAILSAPYIHISNFPDLQKSLYFAREELNNLYNKYGLESITFNDADVRLIEPKVFNKKPVFLRYGKDGGFFDPVTTKTIIRFDPKINASSKYQKIITSYTIIHEETHRSMKGYGFQEYSFYLNEGIADFITRDIMNTKIIPFYLDPEELAENKRNIQKITPLKYNGIVITEEDILIFNPETEDTWGYTRIPEIHFVESLKERNPQVFDILVKKAFCGDTENIREIIGDDLYLKEIEKAKNKEKD